MKKTFESAVQFRQSLEHRLQQIAKEKNTDLQRIRRKVAFERFLARLFSQKPYPWILKGGYSLEVRLKISRATKDIDIGTKLKLADTQEQQLEILLHKLQELAIFPMNDYFLFKIQPKAKFIESAPYGGFRFSIQSFIAGRLFIAFSLDVGFGDAITPPTDTLIGTDWLSFCGIPPAVFEAISLEQQFAEKIHAMAVDRGERENSRTKDLIDIIFLIKKGLNKNNLVESIINTFRRQGSVDLPAKFPLPPKSWMHPFNKMSDECGLKVTFDDAIGIASKYWASIYPEFFLRK